MITGSIFGMEERALKLCEDRASILANNIANSSTPGFKARDFDFHHALKQANVRYEVAKTHENHLQVNNGVDGTRLEYRTPMQTSIDENTVDDELERKSFIENSIRYQASLSFAQSKLSTLMQAIKGE